MYRQLGGPSRSLERLDLRPTGDLFDAAADREAFDLGVADDERDDSEATGREAGTWSATPGSGGPTSHFWSRRRLHSTPEEGDDEWAPGRDPAHRTLREAREGEAPEADVPGARDALSRAYERAGRTISTEGSLRRAALAAPALRGATVLWIDDHPKSILWERRILQELGVRVAPAWSTEVALERLAEEPFDLIISDIARGDRADEGVRALPRLREVQPDAPVVFYVADLDAERGPPAGSAGITDRTGELLHLVLDVLERRRL